MPANPPKSSRQNHPTHHRRRNGGLFRHLNKAEAEDSEPSVVRLAIRLQLEFAARRSETLLLEWAWVDLENRPVALPDSKPGGMPKPMSEEAYRLLSPADKHENSLYMLPSPRDPLEHLTNGEHYNGWSRILKPGDANTSARVASATAQPPPSPTRASQPGWLWC